MIVPAAEFIEGAKDGLRQRDAAFVADQAKEFRDAISGATPETEQAYMIGLEVARMLLATNPKLYKAGIDPKDLL